MRTNACGRTNCSKKDRGKNQTGYLFNHKALAKVFRAKLLEAIRCEGLTLPALYPETWVVDCRSFGSGDKALSYLGRYLYRGVIQEKDIIACRNGHITFRYQDINPHQVLAWLSKCPVLKCQCCGGEMRIVKTQLPAYSRALAPSSG